MVTMVPVTALPLSITSFIDTICLIEFGKNLENCTDDQIIIAIDDLLNFQEKNQIIVLDQQDDQETNIPNSLNIMNSEIIKKDDIFIFKINLYDIDDNFYQLYAEPGFVNLTEWYIEFENAIKLSCSLR